MTDIGYSEEDVKDWEQLPMISNVITSGYFGAWLHYRDKRRDERVKSDLLDKVAERIKEELSEYDFWWHQEFSSNGGYVGESTHDDLIDKIIAGMKAEVQKGAANEYKRTVKHNA